MLRGDIGAITEVLALSFKKSLSSPPKKRACLAFSKEMHLKIPLSRLGLELSNYTPGYRVSVLDFFAK